MSVARAWLGAYTLPRAYARAGAYARARAWIGAYTWYRAEARD
jgi:hypothetical protein